ncbi:glycine-rich cell wall structural protein 1.8-like protein [Leptotrombidium deliense]|uniref:Glycine-rich cell wall structural protein 1.8-like protein n=1 Tax=Leptotrombidium deliense TaxID=299467 RepID=A0A443SJI5_9ACAR|nr:glycine-rich cell wall structural protein 1.8-like protein [Leptotrombidium deliense]
MDGGETRTTTSWAKSTTSKSNNPGAVHVSLGTAMSKKKVKSAIHSSAQTPQKFWESKSFEALLRENQKDGLDNVAPVRQVFKSWEYTKEGNKPAKLIEKSWEKSGDFIVPPTVKVVEGNRESLFKLNDWTTQTPKHTPPVRWDDKPEFQAPPKLKKNFQKFEFEKQREKQPKVKIVAKKLVTLKKSVQTEDIPISGIVNSNNHESHRLIKKEGLIEEPAPKKPDKSSSRIWFKMPSTTTERFTTPQVEYAIEDVSPGTRKRTKKLPQNQVNHQNNQNQNHNQNNAGTRSDQNRPQPQPQRQQVPQKFSYRFEWGKRPDEEHEPPKSESLKKEEPPITETIARLSEEDDDEEVTSLKELDDFQAKWERLARQTFKENQETTTELPARVQKKPKSENIEKSNRQAVRLKDTTSEDFNRNPSAKEKPAKIYSWKQPAKQQTPTQSTPSRLQKRIDTRDPRDREILEDITQRKHNYEIEDMPEERLANQRAPAPKNEDHGDDGKEWRLEDSIPGVPDQDYATFKAVPQTNFKCSDHKLPGYYGDMEAKCQAFHVCQANGRQDSFVCPIGTVFNQQLFVCDWWNNFRCEETPNFYELNANLYDYSKGGGPGPTGGNKPRGTRETDESLADDDGADEPETNSALKSSSIYDAETKGGSHRSQVYFSDAAHVRQALAKRKSRNEALIERRSDSISAAIPVEDEYWAASEEMPAANETNSY